MRTFVQNGCVIEMAAPYDRLAGTGALVGSRFGVAVNDVLSGVSGEFKTEGVFTLASTSAQAWTDGQAIYWDNTNKRADNTVVGPCIGTALGAKANPSATGTVQLNGTVARSPQATIAAVASADADGTYGAAEATLINELKTQYNDLLAKLKTAGVILP